MKKFTILTLILVLLGTVALFVACNDLPDDEIDSELAMLLQMRYFVEFSASDDIYVIKSSNLSDTAPEYNMLLSLQGIVAQTEAAIYYEKGDYYRQYIEFLAQSNPKVRLIYTDSNGDEWTAWTLLNKFRHHLNEGGFVKYSSAGQVDINMAATISGIEGWLSVPASLASRAIDEGLVLRRDLTVEDNDRVALQSKIFEEYKHKLNKKLLIHQNEEARHLRDFGVQNKAFVFYTKETKADKQFRQAVMSWADANTPVLGWTDDEVSFVADISQYGKYVIPADHASNMSYFVGQDFDVMPQKYLSQLDINQPDAQKHYAALVVSDGDNIQWVLNKFSALTDRHASGSDFPLTYTYPPFMNEVAPVVSAFYMNMASNKDYFIAGVSGVGYMNPSKYPTAHLDAFTTLTASQMAKSQMSVVAILDKTSLFGIFQAERLDNYSRYKNIKGGILQIDPSRYEGGRGRVIFSNGKPFISVRQSLWHPSGEREQVDETWLRAQAEKVNGYTKDPSSVDGYSVINVHPWTITMDSLAYFVSQLDDSVQLVSAEELIDLMAANVQE